MRLIVDRFEGSFAVCESEDGSMQDVSRALLPGEVKEGSVLNFDGSSYSLDLAEEEARRNRIEEKMKRLFI
jgi:hypothetical protein